MPTITLEEYLKSTTKSEAARQIGVTREAVGQMLKAGREIYVNIDRSGNVHAWEKRPVPVRQTAEA